jgi:hypothetical protein
MSIPATYANYIEWVEGPYAAGFYTEVKTDYVQPGIPA